MEEKGKQPSIWGILKPYVGFISLLVVLSVMASSLTLLLPRITAHGIDTYIHQQPGFAGIMWQFGLVAVGVFAFTYLQTIVQTYASERVARDLRTNLSAHIARQSYVFIQKITSGKLLTNLTSDIDAIKMFVAQAIASLVSSLFIIIGASILLLMIDWKLALAVLTVIPVIAVTFFLILKRVRALFKKTREVIDWLNKVINESILGAALIRVLDTHKQEYGKFLAANREAKGLGLQILKLFSIMIPIVTLASNLAVLIILVLGGHFVIVNQLSLGDFTAFNSYLAILIFPIFVIGFMSNIIAQAQAAYGRIAEVLYTPDTTVNGTLTTPLHGEVALEHVNIQYGEKMVLQDVSLTLKPRTKTAIIGPTAAGKTQLLSLLIALREPDSGTVTYDGHNVWDYDQETLHKQIGFVFQDSIIFNMSLRENIAFNADVTPENLAKAIDTAELHDFIETLPEKLETIVSERGTSLSGGQKQRIMLARALALNPKILLLDDFTARVDTKTEQKILGNVAKNYPGLTLLSVTQKIASIEHYDQIILLMEGEVLALGTHEELMHTSPEYVQIYNSQRSTSHYELQPE